MNQNILIRNGFIDVPASTGMSADDILNAPINTAVSTIVSNMASYGYVVDRLTFDAMMSATDLAGWWKTVEPVLKKITGADRQMGDFMVYKNFPKEVLDMDRATYVFHQILIYFGIPYDYLRQEEEPRPALDDIKRLKVLTASDAETPHRIYDNLMRMRNKWSDQQTEWAGELVGARNAIVASDFGHKENAIVLAAANFENMEFVPSSATDVLRLAAGLSGADITLREKVKLRRFTRPEKTRLLDQLEQTNNLADDFAARPEFSKRLLERLTPHAHSSYPKVCAAYDGLYNKTAKSFAALVDPQEPTVATLVTASTRPGEYMRRFHYYYRLFGKQAVSTLVGVLPKLSTRQLAAFRAYLRSINGRGTLMYTPRGNWAKAQIVPNRKVMIDEEHRREIDMLISRLLRKRLTAAFPEGVALDMRVDQVRLQSNSQRLAEYGRGTEFDIPASIKFVRSASYWANDRRRGTVWFDNGWNFFDSAWEPVGVCSWDTGTFGGGAAIFSGDPVNTSDVKGRACQMIDLYLDKMPTRGVRYAVWSILCYSGVKFSDAEEVLATLQMGDEAVKGKTYEPARAQMVFPIKSPTLTNFIAYIDMKRRKLVYTDLGISANVRSASVNNKLLSRIMPGVTDHIAAQPTLLEVMQDAPAGTMPVLYDDAETAVNARRAYVFKPVNPDNTFARLSMTDLLEIDRG